MLVPRKVKHRKIQRGDQIRGLAQRKNFVAFGEAGIKAMEAAWVTSRQIESARRAMSHYVQRGGKIWIRIFPDKSITTKGLGVRMGGGKGAVDHYVCPVKPGTVMFEIGGIPKDTAKRALQLAGYKLPMTCKIVYRLTK